ncbi:DUF5819 family protein [Streptomyces sp. NPDC020845]|uniref:DUF5819 family protein n=1 Tax=Streptomyces sp. NPDC020845 TaxID=3365096 RepID=UPI0037B85600
MKQQDNRAPVAWSRSSMAVLVAFGTALIGAAAWHLAAVSLSVAPPNSLSRHYPQWIADHIHPELEQNWKLFAPEPPQTNTEIEARVRTVNGTGARHTGGWTDLTAPDVAALRSNLLPSRADQDLLLYAWDYYTLWHDRLTGHPRQARLMAANLKRTALQRLVPRQRGRQITGLQLRLRFDPVPPPHWASPTTTTNRPATKVLPWWRVQSKDYQGL